MDIDFLLTLLSIGVFLLGAIDFFTNYRQWRSIKRVQGTLETEIEEWKSKGTGGEQLGAWLLAKEAEDKPTNLETCAALVGKQIAGSFSMGLKGIASGESRTLRSVEKAVFEGLETPETKALLAFCDAIGIAREYAGPVLQVLEGRGLLPEVMKRNNGGSQGSGWQI